MSDAVSPRHLTGGTAPRPPGRNFGLDLLRALAIVVVLSNHYFIGFHISPGRVGWSGFASGISASSVLAIEWLFVLSGFLIGAMMIRSFETRTTWWEQARDFWLRRWFRTLPNYYLFLLVNALLSAYGIGSGVFDFKFVIFSQNLAWPEKSPLFFGEAWSLASDEWFYLLMPLLLGMAAVVFRSGSRNTFLAVALLLIAAPTLARLAAPVPTDFFAWDAAIRRVTVFHLDATGWGVLAAIVSRWHADAWGRHKGAKAIAGGLLTAWGLWMIEVLVYVGWTDSMGSRLMNVFSLVLPAAGSFLMLPWLTGLVNNNGAVNWVVDRISLYSYSLYLSHFPMIFVVQAWFAVNQNSSWATVLAASVAWLTLTFSLSGLVFRFFEKPTSDLRDRFTRRVDASPFVTRQVKDAG
jgi:peptidoglycan/LPS O-acetylase OafA/YrhL